MFNPKYRKNKSAGNILCIYKQADGVGEQPVFSPDNKRSDCVLGKVVGNFNLAVFQKRSQILLLVQGIIYRVLQLAADNRSIKRTYCTGSATSIATGITTQAKAAQRFCDKHPRLQ